MEKMISCEFNMDTACVELRYTDGMMISIDCTEVEFKVTHTVKQRAFLDYLIYNAPPDMAGEAGILTVPNGLARDLHYAGELTEKTGAEGVSRTGITRYGSAVPFSLDTKGQRPDTQLYLLMRSVYTVAKKNASEPSLILDKTKNRRETKNMKQYVVDAFTDQVFHGNQAAVCVLDKWLSEELMINITRENNFSETAFTVKEGEKWHLRWFTPGGEIDLCGHATLGTAFVLLNYYEKDAQQVVFTTLSGDLIVTRKGELYEMEFPAYDLKKVDVTAAMEDALGASVKEAYLARDLLCVLDDEQAVRELKPDLEKIKQIDGLLVHVTARGRDEDCVSRSFAPKLSVAEDPVCGSGHCHIIPYWADLLGKNDLVAYQASKRGGTLYCRREGSKIFMAGKAALYSIDELFI